MDSEKVDVKNKQTGVVYKEIAKDWVLKNLSMFEILGDETQVEEMDEEIEVIEVKPKKKKAGRPKKSKKG